MKSITLILFSFVLFSGCADFCSEQDQKIAELQLDLVKCDSASKALETGWIESIKSRDTLELEKAQLQASLQNCNSTLSQNTSAYQASLNNKQTEITSLTNALKSKTTAYDDIYSLHTGLLNDNYIVFKPNVIKALTELNALIFEGETALNQLQNIEPKDEITLQAIKTTEIALSYNNGKRSAIGQLTGVQVQN
jgi:chromosome segregation ATPase